MWAGCCARSACPRSGRFRAYQQDPEAVERWKTQDYAEAKELGATIYFADEAALRSDYHAGTTWAPVGHTPVVRATGARLSVNMISAVTATGSFKYDIIYGSLDAAKFIDFCDKLLSDTDGAVFLIVDGHPAHHAKAVTEYVTSTHGRLRLFRLPPLLIRTQPRRMGLEKRQTRHRWPPHHHRPQRLHSQSHHCTRTTDPATTTYSSILR